MSGEQFFKFNKDKGIDLSSFKLKIDNSNEAGIKENALLNIFDKDKNREIDNSEISAFFGTMAAFAGIKDDDSILDADEAELMLEFITNSEGTSLKDAGISVSDIFNLAKNIQDIGQKQFDKKQKTFFDKQVNYVEKQAALKCIKENKLDNNFKDAEDYARSILGFGRKKDLTAKENEKLIRKVIELQILNGTDFKYKKDTIVKTSGESFPPELINKMKEIGISSNRKTHGIFLYLYELAKDEQNEIIEIIKNNNVKTAEQFAKVLSQQRSADLQDYAVQVLLNNMQCAIETLKLTEDNMGISFETASEYIKKGVYALFGWDRMKPISEAKKEMENKLKSFESQLNASLKNGTFKQTFKKLTGIEYNENKIEEFIKFSTEQNKKAAMRIQGGEIGAMHASIDNIAYHMKMKESFGIDFTQGAQDAQFRSADDGAGLSLIAMIALMAKFSGSAAGRNFTSAIYNTTARVLPKGLARTAASSFVSGTTLSGFTASEQIVKNLTKRTPATKEDWQNTGWAALQSFGFGAFTGAFGATAGKFVTEKSFEGFCKVLKNTKFMQTNTKALSKITANLEKLSPSSSMKAADIIKTLQTTSAPEFAAHTIGFAAEIAGCTGYAALIEQPIKDIFNNGGFNESSIRAAMFQACTSEEEIEHVKNLSGTELLFEYTKEKLGEQAEMLTKVKGISTVLGAIASGKFAQYSMLNSSEIRVVNINKKKMFEIKTPLNEKAIIVETPEMAVFVCKQIFALEIARINDKNFSTENVNLNAGESKVRTQTINKKPKFKTEINEQDGAGVITQVSPEGQIAGSVKFNLITCADGKKVLHFERLESQIEGAGIGKKLISELVKKSFELGAEGRIEAETNVSAVKDGKPLTNLGFFYRMGFRAADPKIDTQIRECIENGQEIPIMLNFGVKLEYKNTKPEIDRAVADIQSQFNKTTCNEIVTELEYLGFGNTNNMVHRAKSYQSLFDKIKNFIIENPDMPIETAIKNVRDGFGARMVVESGNFAQKTSGTIEERINQAVEMQSQALYEAIIRNIDELSSKGSGLSMIRMSNYTTSDGKYPYLTKTQYEKIKDYAAERGIDFSGNEIINASDPKSSEVTPFNEYEGGVTKKQPSGYPAFQMNFKTKDGKVLEYQFRGDRINIFAEGEHLHYDLFTNKDIIGQTSELQPLYGPIKAIFAKMTKDAHKNYLRYWQDYNIHLRKLELGFESTEPKLEDYGNFDIRINARNLVHCHELGEKIKKGNITADNAVREFNTNIDNIVMYHDIRCKIKTSNEFKQFEQNLESRLQKFSYLMINDSYISRIRKIAANDIELANKFIENIENFYTDNEIAQLYKAASIDRGLTIELLEMKEKRSVSERLKNKKALNLFYEPYSLIEIVKSAQKNRELTFEFLSKAQRANLEAIPNIVEIAKIDKELAVEFFTSQRYSNYAYILEALKIDKNLTREIIAKDKTGALTSFEVLNIVEAFKVAPEYMLDAEQSLNFNKYNNAKDFAELASSILYYGEEAAGKKYTDLTDYQKVKLQNNLMNQMTSIRTSDVIKKRFPILPKNLDEYITLMEKLNNDLSKPETPYPAETIKKFHDELRSIQITQTQIQRFIDTYLPNFESKSNTAIAQTVSKVLENKEFQKLTPQEQNLVLLSTIFSNASCTQTESAYNAYKTALKYGYSKIEAEQIFQIVKNSNLIENFMNTNKSSVSHPYKTEFDLNNRQAVFDRLAFDLKDGNTYNLARIVYTSKDKEGLTRFLDRKLETRIQEMKADDFMLPQTPASVYKQKAVRQNINGFNVNVVYASEIENFYAYVHNPHGISMLKGDLDNSARYTKLNGSNNIASERVMCASYISNDNICAQEAGFIYEVSANNQHIAVGHDIGSLSKTTNNMLAEYYTPNNVEAKTHSSSKVSEYKVQERQMVSKNIKEILHISSNEYIQRMDNLKKQLGEQTFTLEEAEKIDPELVNAYRIFLSRTNYDSAHGLEALMSSGNWNECIISKGKLCAIYAVKVSDLNKDLLQKAQNEGLTIVILKNN